MATELNMKAKLKLRLEDSLIDEMMEFLNEHNSEYEMIDELEQYEDNVIPFPNPKDTIH